MVTTFEMNKCCECGVQLAPDDFDAICPDCDEKVEAGQEGGGSND